MIIQLYIMASFKINMNYMANKKMFYRCTLNHRKVPLKGLFMKYIINY